MRKNVLKMLTASMLTLMSIAPISVQAVERDESNIVIESRPEIVGLWEMRLQNNEKKKNQCTEYYNFKDSGDVIIHSDKEWSVGKYVYAAPNKRVETLPAMVIQIEYDNNEVDCAGNQINQTGSVEEFYLKWLDKNNILLCGDERGTSCYAKLNKPLPQ